MSPDFWKDNERASNIQQEISEIKDEIGNMEDIKKEIEDLKVLQSFGTAQDKFSLKNLEKKIGKQEFKTFLSGKYDRNNAILEIFSGAGGQDSQDWAAMVDWAAMAVMPAKSP